MRRSCEIVFRVIAQPALFQQIEQYAAVHAAEFLREYDAENGREAIIERR